MKFGFTLPSYTWPGLDYKMTYRVTKDMARRWKESHSFVSTSAPDDPVMVDFSIDGKG